MTFSADPKYIYTFKMEDNTLRRDIISHHPDHEEFYLLTVDPSEKQNPASPNPNICLHMRRLINQTLGCKSDSDRPQRLKTKIRKDTEEQLKSLGYIR